MAITAVITLDRSQTTINQKVRALCTVSNSGANPVTILNAVPKTRPSNLTQATSQSTVALGKVIAGQIVPASGSNTFVFDVMYMQPSPTTTYDSPAAQNTYNLVCDVYTDDGSVTTTAPVTVLIIPNKNYGSF